MKHEEELKYIEELCRKKEKALESGNTEYYFFLDGQFAEAVKRYFWTKYKSANEEESEDSESTLDAAPEAESEAIPGEPLVSASDKLYAIKVRCKLTNEALGKKLGVSASCISQWIHGVCKPERLAYINSIDNLYSNL